MRIAITVLALSLTCFGQLDKLEEIFRHKILTNEKAPSLSRSTATNVSYSWKSNYFNVNYVCPAGWSIVSIDTTINTYFITVRRAAYFDILVFGTKHTTSSEARFYNYCANYTTTKVCYNESQLMPGIYDIYDTTYAATGISFSRSKVKYYKTSTSSYTDIGITYSENLGIYQHGIMYQVPIGEYTGYDTAYTKNWLNLNFQDYKNISIQRALAVRQPTVAMSTTNGITTISLADHQRIKLDLVNIEGRKIAAIYDGELSGTNVFDLNDKLTTNQIYLLRMKSDRKSEVHKIIPVK